MCLLLGFGFGMKGLGVWLGLAFALIVAAVALVWRFHTLSRSKIRAAEIEQ
jgi:MATE family multidrug resistance protein